jgi:hypothetical protein
MSQSHDDRATLDGLSGRGYGVVESLPSLGKGRRLTGLFRTGTAYVEPLKARLDARRPLPFEGTVHFRHHSLRARLAVELARVVEERDELVVEFIAYDVPYSLG